MLRFLTLSLLLSASASAQTTWYVDLTATPPGSGTQLAPYASINFALQRPSTLSGDTVLVASGTYLENVSFPGRGVSLISINGAAVTTIDANGSGSAVSFLSTDGSTMLLKGFTITGGTGTNAGGNDQGGGIFASNCIAKVRKCIVENNTAFEGGGVYAKNSNFDMRTSTVRNNTVLGFSPTGAGLMFVGGNGTLRRSIIQDNTAGFGASPGTGGGIYAVGPLSIRRCSIADNFADFGGGGVYGSDEIAGCRIIRNSGQFGGGVNGSPTITSTSFRGNRADSQSGGFGHFGGGVYGAATLINCFLDDNYADGEGGAANGATLIRCTISNNRANDSEAPAGRGAGVAFCVLTDCTLIGNSASTFNAAAEGGGAYQSTLTDCVLADNVAQVPSAPFRATGGGAFGCTLIGCQVVGNSTNGYGGGVYGGTTLSTELVGNSAQWGGAAASASLDRTTVFGNTATVGADGIHVEFFSNSSVVDSIVWLNGTSEIVVEPGGSIGVTFSDVLGGWPGSGNINANPLFWNRGANDVHLQAGSPCIDAGDPASALDPDGSRADMGAYPFDPAYQG